MKRVLRSKELKAMSGDQLREIFSNTESSALERTLVMREINRRDDEAERVAKQEEGTEGVEDEDSRLVIRIRNTISMLVTEFGEGHTTAAKAAWEISVLSGVPYLYTSAVFSVAVEMEAIEGIEVRRGVAEADTRRGLIDRDHLKVYEVVAQGSMDDIRRFIESPGSFVTTKRGGKPSPVAKKPKVPTWEERVDAYSATILAHLVGQGRADTGQLRQVVRQVAETKLKEFDAKLEG